jgi:HK97 family phage major capsid protein
MTEEIVEDSAINLTQLIGALFAEAVAKEEDLQFFAGDGTTWTGILNNGEVNVVYQATAGITNLRADDLLSMIDATPSGALSGAKFYMNRTVLSVIRKLKTTTTLDYIFQNPGQGLPATIWNYPYELSDAFPTAASVAEGSPYILFGNLKQSCIFGDKQQLRVKLLEEATITDTDGQTSINLAEQDMVALRVVERVGYVIGLPTALTVLDTAEES